MRYSILTYNPNISISKYYFTFNTKPKFLKNAGRLAEEYYHDYFGFYEENDELILSHAADAIDDLKLNPDDERAKQSLLLDLKYYCHCIFSEEERKETYYLVEAIAGFGFLEELAEIIEDYYHECEDKAKDDNCIGISQTLDFRKLYIKIADKALFVDENINTAVKFYKLAGAYWDYDIEMVNPTSHFEDDSFSGLSKDDIVSWHEKADLFEKLSQGFTKLDDLWLDIPDPYSFKMYDIIMDCAVEYDYECIKMTDLFIEKYGKDINRADDFSRCFLLMLASIKRNRGIQILYLLSQDEKVDHCLFLREICSLIQSNNIRKYDNLRNWVMASKDTLAHKVEVIMKNVEAAYNVDRILSLLRMEKNSVESSAYYTSYNTFSLMLPDQCIGDRREECGMLSIMNVSYMNDPNEGQTIRRFLYGKNIPLRKTERREINTPYVFIKCFTPLIDYLPMWQMYGDMAKGVCIVTDWSKNDNVSLYKVCYLNYTNNGYSVKKDQNPKIDTFAVSKHIKILKGLQQKLKKLEERMVFDSMIEPISYLFKDSSYSYEQEYRMMFSFKKVNKRIKHTKQNPPKLFVLSEHPVQIDELILGPCFENVADTMPYLREQLELMAKRTGTIPPRITISNIDFR